MAEQHYPEITFLRSRSDGGRSSSEQDPHAGSSRPAQKRVRKDPPAKGASSGGRSPRKGPVAVDPDERLRHVASIVLFLAAALILLALISYTPHDQANVDVRPRDVIGLVTNDAVVAARADTTENWLGLVGAMLAHLLVNATLGYATIVVPLLIGLWGVALYRGRDYDRSTSWSLYTLGVVTILASILGTVQLIGWMPHPAHEWSGSIGAFLGTVISGLIGTAGSLLLLLAALAITLIYATKSDLHTAVRVAREFGARISRNALTFSDGARTRFGELKREESESALRDRQVGSADRPSDDEPARMMRRMRPNDSSQSPGPVEVRRRANAHDESYPMGNDAQRRREPLPDLVAAAPVMRNEPRPSKAVPTPLHTATPAHDPSVNDLADGATRIQRNRADVELVREDLASPVEETRSTAPTTGRLTLNVQEGETDADIETHEGGELITPYRDEEIKYVPPSIDFLVPQNELEEVDDEELKENGRILQEKLGTFNIQIENLTVTPGPVVTLYEFVPAAGIKISQIESLADDLALAMKARGIRIIAPIPGKGTVGVEIPNHKPSMVRIRSVVNTAKFREANLHLPLALGKTTIGEVYCDDLTKMPHLLIAGATGSGKSVGINAILASLLYKMHPRDLKFVIIDPKKIELAQYRALADHFLARCPDIDEDIITNPQNAVIALKSLEMEMDRRYDILAKGRQRNILDYNTKVDEGAYKSATDFHHIKLPYIVAIIDELADLMITAGREVEEPIARLAQLARAVGVHLVVATQRPSVDVITGMIKANFPARIAYQVATKVDSRTILDSNGAEQLLGNGDMLYLPGGQPKPLRLQNAFISTEEVEALCEHIGEQTGYTQPYMLPSIAQKGTKSGGGIDSSRDDLFSEAAHLVVRHQQGSVSLVQRRLKVGYSRAARIIDELEMAGVVGPFDGSKARAVLVEDEDDLEMYL